MPLLGVRQVRAKQLSYTYFVPLLFDVNYLCRFRRLFLPVHLLFPTPLLSHSGAVAGDVNLQDDGVVDYPVDDRCRSLGLSFRTPLLRQSDLSAFWSILHPRAGWSSPSRPAK